MAFIYLLPFNHTSRVTIDTFIPQNDAHDLISGKILLLQLLIHIFQIKKALNQLRGQTTSNCMGI